MIGLCLLLLAGAITLGYQLTVGRYDRNIARTKGVIDNSAKDRPKPPAGGENWLIVGSDSRQKDPLADAADWKPGQQRSDTIMLVHMFGDGKRVSVTSFPRDSWVDVPGHGKQKINAAFSYGGPRLLVRTVEQLTDIRIDHFAAVDFNGFKTMTDAVGGVDVFVPRTVTDSSQDRVWTKGRHHLDGEDALAFVRQRHGLPNGDLDRIKRQQTFLLALLAKASSRHMLTNPGRLDAFLDATSKAMTVDDSVDSGDLRTLALRYRGIGRDDILFGTVPIRSSGNVGGQAVLFVDEPRAEELFTALRHDRAP